MFRPLLVKGRGSHKMHQKALQLIKEAHTCSLVKKKKKTEHEEKEEKTTAQGRQKHLKMKLNKSVSNKTRQKRLKIKTRQKRLRMKLDRSALRQKHLQDKSVSNEQDISVSKKLKIEASGEEVSTYLARIDGSISRRNLKCPSKKCYDKSILKRRTLMILSKRYQIQKRFKEESQVISTKVCVSSYL